MVSTDVWAFANAFHEDIGLDVALLFPPWLENGLGPCHAGWSERIMALFSGTIQQDYFSMGLCFIVLKQRVVD